ncbi:glycoside hydrolase family 3 N-terminal domain-containing protein [Persicobacter diffluens]|uniref:beta-glucosidase n=1 Tax=Persicobacter diffluens TaxID=981 RepID=A0AAN4W4L4_9BACT|nr:glycosyl hydrolase [Persicobacter diffluens]
MKKIFFWILLLNFQGVLTEAFAQEDSDKYIDTLIGKMTLSEKVGQMTQLTLEMVSKGDGYKMKSPHELDEAKLEDVLLRHHIGSILNCAGTPHTIEKWGGIINKIQEVAMKDRLQIPVLYGIDAIHGANYTIGATLYPQEIGLAASWNLELVEQAAALTAYETRASGIPWTFSPTLDLAVNPEWPRVWESFGEDPHLMAEMGVAMTKGFQGDDVAQKDRIAACLKHFVGYGAPKSGKDRSPAWIPERMMREYFLPPFQAAIDAGAKSIMINSGEVNGVPVHASKWLLTDILRDEMGFEGVAVTDWFDIWNLVERHAVAKDKRQAVKMAIDAGVDMSMVPLDLDFGPILISLVEDGEISMERIDLSVRRILKMKQELGLFENYKVVPGDYPAFASKKHQQVAFDLAAESITLLKNEAGFLPISKKSKILLCGPNANSMRPLNGGWSYSWQGDVTDQYAQEYHTIYEAFVNKFGKKNINLIEGVSYDMAASYDVDQWVNPEEITKAAEAVDYIVLCLGENSYTEKPGDLNDLSISANQRALAKVASATGKPVILVLTAGRPRVIHDIVSDIPAVLHTYLPGNYGADALSEILTGEVNPSGKLPYTYPRYTNDLVPYYHKVSEGLAHNDGNEYTEPFFNPQWEFGYGLSYTQFEYSNLEISSASMSRNGSLKITVEVKNVGKRAGKEVVQLYLSDLVATVSPSVKRLKRFQKIDLQPGASEKVVFKLEEKDLAFVGIDQQWVAETGTFKVCIGGESTQFELVESIK